MDSTAKDEKFWKKIKEGASVKIDKKKLDGLFEK